MGQSKNAEAGFTYEEFFGRGLCSKRSYQRRKPMRRADTVGPEKCPPPPPPLPT